MLNVEMNKNELLNDYIGPNYISFLNGGFSFACLFFTWIYLFYRKQYKLAFILMFLTLITNVIYYYSANYMIYIFMQIILLAITFFIAVSFKKEYVKKATEFINQKRNEGIQGNDLKLICQKAGGVDYKAFLWMVIMGIANFSLSFITASALNKQELQAHFPKELEGALENRKEDLYKDNGKTVSKMSFTYEDANNNCEFALNKTDKYKLNKKDGDEIYSYYLREFYYMNVETKEEQFANVAFHVYEDQTTNTSHYLYANKRNISEISIKINKDLDGKCTEYKNYILNNTNIGK